MDLGLCFGSAIITKKTDIYSKLPAIEFAHLAGAKSEFLENPPSIIVSLPSGFLAARSSTSGEAAVD
ncbi:hypothetical protein [Labrenzia sp. OB1]|uniref:hypothetical protein n=1 Tax=Labrenzia sp. OB1 TaxID=1561204 RepID=UPI000AA24B0C|nr:hypothetical protein [Labrenzia sp. OB1]